MKQFLFLLIGCLINLSSMAQTWIQKANHLNAPRYDFAGFSVNGKCYIVGGRLAGVFNALNEVQQYNPDSNNWTLMTPMPYPFTALNAFTVSNNSYVVNGVNDAFYNYDTYKYNQIGNNWSTNAAVSYPRLYAATTATTSRAYMIGGYGFSAEALNDLWEYNPIADTWTEKDTMPMSAARYYAAAFSIADSVYVFGGTNDTGYINDLWKYTLTTNIWTMMASLPAAPRQQSLSFVLNNEAYIVGGTTINGNTKEVWKYRPATNSWIQLPDFPGNNAPVGGTAMVINNKAYIISANGSKECWEYTAPPVGIEAAIDSKYELTLFPNPVNGTLSINIPEILKKPFTIMLTSIDGSIVKVMNSNNNHVAFNCERMSKGQYYITVIDANASTKLCQSLLLE